MLITVNEFIEQAYDKYNELKYKYIDTLDWEKYSDYSGYEVKYGKDTSILFSDKPMFSASILRHIDANKCLFSKLFKKIPKSSKPQEYTAYYYDNEKLIMSEFKLDAYSKQITFYISNDNNEKVQITFFIMPNENGQPQKHLSSLEYSVYDDNKLIKCETYINQSKPPYGISVYGEYYQYENSKLIKAIKYDNYNSNFKMDAVMKELCPTLVINPYIYEYEFEYLDNSVFCQKTRKHSQNENNTNRYELKRAVLNDLSDNGVACFGM